MAIIKCKMCGGDLHFAEGASICECEYCGNTNTLPKQVDDQEINLFNRANHFRMINEFDKAISAYEKILEKDGTNAEAYWGIVLSRYGIEYVEDPRSHERIPTCHRVQMTSILSDPDFLYAIQYADPVAAEEYRMQAERIAEIQKGILAISSQEKPYDVFICYKESDSSGKRTIDSTLAQDIYYRLTDEGYRVFFARVTLEDKLGQEYEPYIFAALNSAKVMIVVGTRPEYFSAVWVKNEWSRYLDQMKMDRHRILIPCYRDMDPYDLPDELSILQSQDMGRIGFMQDLLRGVQKVLDKEKDKLVTKETVVMQQGSQETTAAVQVKRGNMALEDRDWDRAEDFYEKALNLDPECSEAYLGLLMVIMKACTIEEARRIFVHGDYTKHANWKRAVQFSSGEIKTNLKSWVIERDSFLEKKRERARAEEEEKRKEEANKQGKLRELREQLLQLNNNEVEFDEEEKAHQSQHDKAVKDMEKRAEDRRSEYETCSEKQELAQLKTELEMLKVRLSKKIVLFHWNERQELTRRIHEITERIKKLEEEVEIKHNIYFGALRLKEIAKRQAYNYRSVVIKERKKYIYRQIWELVSNNYAASEVTFGTYDNGTKLVPIEWVILEGLQDSFLLISKHCVEVQQFNNDDESNSWNSSNIRHWLNHTFLQKAFTEDERLLIRGTTIPEEKTFDRIFILSLSEVKKYMPTNDKRRCRYTKKAFLQIGGYCDDCDDEYCGSWWLRTESRKPCVYSIDHRGSISDSTNHRSKSGVRPVLWIRLSE